MARDGRSRAVRLWAPPDEKTRATLVLGHGYLEHGGRYREFAHVLAASGIAMVALDLQGHGRSPGRAGFVHQFADYDVDVATAIAQAPTKPVFYLGHSLGGLIILDYLSRHRQTLAGLILTNPYLQYTPPGPAKWRVKLGRWAGRWAPFLSVDSGLRPDALTSDTEMQAAIRRDPLIHVKANASWFRETTLAQARLAPLSLTCPLLMLTGDADSIASPDAARAFFEETTCPDKKLIVRHNEKHELLFERGRAELYDSIAVWIAERL